MSRKRKLIWILVCFSFVVILVIVVRVLIANKPPTPSFSYLPENPQVGEEISFNASESYDPDGEITTWQWTFGDGDTSFGRVVKHTYVNPSDYEITLKVEDNKGEFSQKTIRIRVFPAKLRGLCYGPFRDGEDPNYGVLPTEEELQEDIDFIKNLTDSVRTYGGTGSLKIIPDLCDKAGLDCYIGAWISNNNKENEKEIEGLIEVASQNLNHTKGLIVGNEVLLRGDLTEDELIGYIEQVRSEANFPVGTAEPWSVWLSHPELAQSVDLILVHVHPYWEGISISDAVNYVSEKWQGVKEAYPGKTVVIGETGWPSEGDSNGPAIPNEENQREFLSEFCTAAQENGIEYFYFDVFDERWKEKAEAIESGQVCIGSVGSHWGLYYSDGSIKPRLRELVPLEVQSGVERPPRVLSVISATLPWIVYTDCDSPQNHFFPTGWMGDLEDIAVDTQCNEIPYSGESCVEISYSPEGPNGWAGIYWQYPLNNWGDYPGYNISGATRLTFWARGQKGGERAEFKVSGIEKEGKPYQDSAGPVSLGVVELTNQWKEYSIDLKGQDLSVVIGGFCWVTNTHQNPQGCVIYVDEIQFESKEVKSVSDLFFPSGWMGDWGDIEFDDGCTDNPYSGPTCIGITYSATQSQGKGWAGIYWQYPELNWGDNPDGRDLTDVTKLIFWARGKKGGEKAEFKVGGITGKYPDSIQPAVSTSVIVLSGKWQQFTIDLAGKDLSHVVGGLCWVTSKNQNPSGCTIYLDYMMFE
jgi:exo-beta-1,3-glucanase (GH17 family)